jgi:hypothetical protein
MGHEVCKGYVPQTGSMAVQGTLQWIPSEEQVDPVGQHPVPSGHSVVPLTYGWDDKLDRIFAC